MFPDPGDRVTLRKQVLRSITYPDWNELPPIAPTSVVRRPFCNAASFEQEFGRERTSAQVLTGTTSCFRWDISTTGGFEVTTSATVSGGVPGIGEAEASASATAHWALTAGAGSENCRESTAEETKEFEFPEVVLPPMTALTYTLTQYRGTLSAVRFEAVLDQHWSDGSTTSKTITGTYEGVSYSDVHQSFHDMRTVDSCSRRLDDHNETIIAVDADENETAMALI